MILGLFLWLIFLGGIVMTVPFWAPIIFWLLKPIGWWWDKCDRWVKK